MDTFEEEVQYFVDLISNNIQEARSGKRDKEEAVWNCISVNKDGKSVFVYNLDKDYCYELVKKDIAEYHFNNKVTKYLALYYIVKNIIQQKNNIMDQLKLLRRNRNIPEVREYIDKLYNGKYASKYLKYLIDKYYYGKKNLIRPKKNGLEIEFKMLLH